MTIEINTIYKVRGENRWYLVYDLEWIDDVQYAHVWDDSHGGYWSGQRMVPTSSLMPNRKREKR